MTIQTEITTKDFKAFTQHVAMGADSGHSMKVLLVGSALGTGAFIGITLFVTGVQLDLVNLLAGLFGATIWLIIFSRLYARNLGPATDGYMLGPRTVSITEDGIRGF